MKFLPNTFLPICFLILACYSSAITVSNTAGNSLDIDVLSYNSITKIVKLKRLDNNVIMTVKIDVFDDASQKKIVEAAPAFVPPILMTASVGKRRKDVGNSFYLEKQTISTTASVINQSRDTVLEETKFTFFLIGRNTLRYRDRDADSYIVLMKDTYNARLGPGEEFKAELPEVVTEYDSDKDSSNVGGWLYQGYFTIATNAKGDIIDAQTSIGKMKPAMADFDICKEALSLSAKAIIDSNLKPIATE